MRPTRSETPSPASASTGLTALTRQRIREARDAVERSQEGAHAELNDARVVGPPSPQGRRQPSKVTPGPSRKTKAPTKVTPGPAKNTPEPSKVTPSPQRKTPEPSKVTP